MDEFERWKDEYALYAERDITEADCLAAFKAGREAGMREAAGLCQSHEPKDFTTAGIITRAKCADAILSAIDK